MATVYVTLGDVGAKTENGITNVFRSGSLSSETITSSATTASGSLIATGRQLAQIVCETPVYATAGSTPTATTTNGIYVPANLPSYISMQPGDKIAVIDV